MTGPKITEEKNDEAHEFDPVEFLKTLQYDDFVNCNKAKVILDDEHYWNYEKKLSKDLKNIYDKYNTIFGNNILFNKDPNKIYGVYFADLIYKFIQKKYDITIFYDDLGLAAPLFELYDK